jgi:tRNA A-37 threonylcarbamoyl transferase component Bud32
VATAGFGSLGPVSGAAGGGSPVGSQQVLARRYRLVRLLAEGGMAAVWEGRDEVLARPVAVKVPHPDLAADPAFRERFRREAVAAARLAHPGIVATYDTGADGDVDFIVMELVPGRTVRDLVEQGRVPPEVAMPIAAQVAEALEVAHAAGIVHRDIKPANLLLVDDGPVLRVKVADFGVARAQDGFDDAIRGGDVTRDGIVVGTARYLAPEQVGARHLDGRTDVYAVGCVLHEMLAGQPPFVRDTDLATALAHLTEPPPTLSSLGVTVDPALEHLVLACLAKAPADRPASAAVLARELRTLAAPAVGPPTAPVPRVELVGSNAGASGGSATAALPVGAPAHAPRPPAPSPPPALKAPARQPGGRRRTRTVGRPARSRAPLFVVGSLVVAALATALLVVALPRDPAAPPGVAATTTAAASIRPVVAEVMSFDPEADRRENDHQLSRLTDGNPATTWSTEEYRVRPVFGNLKEGVGVVLVLERAARLGSLRVRSTTKAWAAQVFLAPQAAATLPGWGQPVARASAVPGDAEIDLDGKTAGAVLLWFTDPGPKGQVVVGELELVAP